MFKAAWIAPMDSPVIRGGAVAFANGQILAVGPAGQVLAAHPDAESCDLGEVVVLAGLINAHAHLELSTCAAWREPGAAFVDWIMSIRQRMGGDGADLAEVAAAATSQGIAQCLRFGITCVGDITQQIEATRPVIARSPLRCISYGEALGLAKLRWRFEELLPVAIDPRHATRRLRIGLSPHAPYTVDLNGYKQCIEIARQRGLPLATHLAETPDERPFLVWRAGAFRDLWERIGHWDESVPTCGEGPIHFARAIGMLDYPTLLAHVNYCDDEELEMLRRGRASVVYCPRTHAYFGHPPHRWREMLAGGVNVAVGTDSCASSPNLNLVDDLRLLRKLAPEVPAQTLWELATVRAAKALMMDREIGSISPGKRADFVAFDADGDDPLEQILQSDRLPAGVWIDGAKT